MPLIISYVSMCFTIICSQNTLSFNEVLGVLDWWSLNFSGSIFLVRGKLMNLLDFIGFMARLLQCNATLPHSHTISLPCQLHTPAIRPRCICFVSQFTGIRTRDRLWLNCWTMIVGIFSDEIIGDIKYNNLKLCKFWKVFMHGLFLPSSEGKGWLNKNKKLSLFALCN